MRQHAPHNALVRDEILPRVLRRLVAAGGKDELAACVAHVAGCKDATERRRALEGMALAAQGRLFDVPPGWALLSARLNEDPDPEVRRLARSLGVRFRDLGALRRALEIARDTSRGADERCAAVRDLAAVPLPEARQPLLELLARDKDAELRAEACRALVGYDGSHVARAVLAGWKTYPPPLRAEAVNLLTGRREWAAELLAAVADGRVPRAELTDNSVLRMRALRDARLDALIRTTWGQVRDTPAGLAALIDRMRKELDAGPGSFERGRKVFDNHCAKCHRFEGRGHDVGPALDGAARDVEYLLANVLDPNRVVGRPYFLYLVALKNGRVESGLLAAEDGTSLTLKAENGATKVIPRKEVEELTVQEKSIMPEGLAGAMTPQDFRDLVRYLMANPYLTAVEVAGPFPDPAAAPPADATWSRPTVGVTGRIPLPPGDQGVAFVRAAVTAPSALKVRLVAEAGQPIAVWLNGAPAGTVSPEGGIDLQLRRGRNELVLRATSRDASEGLRVRLLDPERRLAYPEGER
jgi:putative heme-binding domain-containing protein